VGRNEAERGLDPAQPQDFERLIKQCEATKSLVLSLYVGSVAEIPEAVWGLTWLEELHLSRSADHRVKLIIPAAIRARAAPLSGRPWVQPVRLWAQLQRLKKLTLNNVELVDADLKLIGELSQLQTLECGTNPVTTLESLRGLTQLTVLDCGGTQVSDLEPLRGLTQLTALDCADTRVSDLEPLGGLTQLTSLYCGYTQVRDLEPLRDLTQLTSLNCISTRVSDLEPLRGLTQLTWLSCGYTQVRDLEPLRGLTQLTSLFCGGTQVWDLEPLRGLTRLNDLYCEDLALRDIPPELTRVECSRAVRGYYLDLEQGTEPERSAKVLLVGNSFAGKTTLAHGLVHGKPPANPIAITDRTHAIVSQALTFEGVEARLWDFAGQEIYHATHRLFLRASGVFVLLWTEPDPDDPTPTAERHGPGYWLDLIDWFGGGPIIVVKNKVDILDSKPDPLDLSQRSTQITHRLKLAAGVGKGISTLRAVLHEELRSLVAARASRIGASWVRARTQLSTLTDKHLSREAFDALARECGVLAPDVFLTYLMNTGYVFYAADAFGGRVFLDQGWIIDATYRMFDPRPLGPRQTLEQLQNGGEGTISGVQLQKIVWPEASEQEVEHYLLFLTGSEMIFEITDPNAQLGYELAERRFMIPALLPEVRSVKLQQLRDRNTWSVYLEFTFQLLHRALIERLLVRTASKNPDRQWWRNASEWYDEQTACHVLFEAQPQHSVISLSVAPGRHGKVAEAVARLMLLMQESEQQLSYTLSFSADGEHFATIEALESARQSESDVACRDARAVSRDMFTAVYEALHTSIPEPTHSGYSSTTCETLDRAQEPQKPATSTNIIQIEIVNTGSANMGNTYRNKVTNSPGTAVAQGEHANATASATIRSREALTQEEYEQEIDETHGVLMSERRQLDADVWKVLDEFLRVARELNVGQLSLAEQQSKVTDALDDIWVAQKMKELKSNPLSDGLKVAQKLLGNPVMQEVAKKLVLGA